MTTIHKYYDYLFFTFYRFWEKAPSKWWSEWKAMLTIDFLKIFFLLGLFGYILFYKKLNLLPETPVIPIIIALVLFGTDYYYFLYKNKWKKRIKNFENIDSSTDRIGIILVLTIIILAIIFLIYSYYLMSTVDWKNIKE